MLVPVRLALSSVLMLVGVTAVAAQPDDQPWARWRGAQGNGVAAADAAPPVEWDEDKNMIWKVKVPGRGHASPIILGDEIFLATAVDNQAHVVLCFDRESGQQQWKKVVNEGGLPRRIHPNNSHASSTIATDGESLFAVFSIEGKIKLFALSLTGDVRWSKTVGDYRPQYPFGFGASPIVYRDKVIVTNDSPGEGIVAYDKKSGDQIWKINRGDLTSYSTPVVADVGGKKQLLISGGKRVCSYDPETGKQNWETAANWIVTCGTMVWDGDLVFASGGFPAAQTLAIDARSGDVVWTNSSQAYEQSMLAHDGFLYSLTDRGVIYCWRASNGEVMWRERFVSKVSTSPVLAGGNLYFTAEDGSNVVVKATPEKYQEISRNQLGDSSFASPAIVGDRMYVRYAVAGQEYLACLGKKSQQ